MTEPTADKDDGHFVQIETGGAIYRFYGLGIWKVQRRDDWAIINAIYVPAEALRVAATQCHPEPPAKYRESEIWKTAAFAEAEIGKRYEAELTALRSQNESLRVAIWSKAIEAAARVVEQWSLPTIQTPSMWLIDQRGIAAEIRALSATPGSAGEAMASRAKELADRADGCLNCRNSAYPSDVLRDCIKFLREIAARSPATAGAPSLLTALKRMVDAFRPFTMKPVGGPGSAARMDQEEQKAAHTDAIRAIAAAEGR